MTRLMHNRTNSTYVTDSHYFTISGYMTPVLVFNKRL